LEGVIYYSGGKKKSSGEGGIERNRLKIEEIGGLNDSGKGLENQFHWQS